MRKTLILSTLCILLTASTQAQRGMLEKHIGLRFGLGTGVSFQHLFSDEMGVEFIALGRLGGLNFTTLWEFHNQFFDVRGLKWYLGGGAHAGLYSNRARNFESEAGNSVTLGVDGIVGLEYFLHDFPLQFSVDWKPAFNLYSTAYKFNEWDCGALSVRYRF